VVPKDVWFIPLLHPAAILRGNWNKEPAQRLAVDRIAELLRKDQRPAPWQIEEPPPGRNLFPTLEELREFYRETTDGPWDALAHDLENAGPHIICDGMCQANLETGEIGRSVCLRFRRQGGSLYWTNGDSHLEATQFLWDVLADPDIGKVFHNGVTHDVPILEQLGFEVRGRLVDTMILMHTAYSELPKGLQYLATFFNFSPVWKSLTDEKDEEEGKS